MTKSKPVLTARLEIRLPDEEDRERFVQLFGDRAFMVFSGGVLDHEAANRRFDQMLERAAEISFAKQPIIERSSGAIIGYSGVDRFEFEEEPRLEYGYRLVPEARGRGYATEAGLALLAAAADTLPGRGPRLHRSFESPIPQCPSKTRLCVLEECDLGRRTDRLLSFGCSKENRESARVTASYPTPGDIRPELPTPP
jgi:RimJ/RimL family protein N-acetyltransferase